jgi:DNA helicase-2/ATP-dependent DNA helicase PcrA
MDVEINIEDELSRLKSVRLDLQTTVKSISENILGEASQVLIGTAETKDEWGALEEQLHTYNSLNLNRNRSHYPSSECPYFGRIILDEPNHNRDVLIGYGSLVGGNVSFPVVDWKKAPVSKLFFECRSGEAFEQELPKRLSLGVVTARFIYGIHRGELTSIWSDTGKRMFLLGSKWTTETIPWVIPLAGGEGKAVRAIDPTKVWNESDDSDAVKLLDENQRKALDAPGNESLLILGGAGSGKTTVALLRLAKLMKALNHQGSSRRPLVLVPHEGLKRLCLNILKTMNVAEIQVVTFDEWISKEGSKVLKGLPRRLYNSTPSSVVKIKRSTAMLHLLDKYLGIEFENIKKELVKNFSELSMVPIGISFIKDSPLVAALDELQNLATRHVFTANRERLNRFFSQIRSNIYDVGEDRIALFTDESLLGELVDEHQGITRDNIEHFIEHSRRQFFNHFSQVEVELEIDSHIALDGRDETLEDEEDIYKSIDVEDYALLFHLLRKKTGQIIIPGKGELAKLTDLVLDEAQELSESELKILGYALEAGGSVTLAGDEGQLTTSEEAFMTWDHVLSAMGLENVSRTRLVTNYRSTKAVADLGMHILGPLAKELPEAIREGLPVFVSKFDGLGPGCAILSDTIRDVLRREENASIAVIVRDERSAKLFFELFQDLDTVRLVKDGSFSFDPGVDFCSLDDVKGLEFDYVIVPDAHSFVYKEDSHSRRALYVAVTRAVYGLWIYSTAKPSPLLESWLPSEEHYRVLQAPRLG